MIWDMRHQRFYVVMTSRDPILPKHEKVCFRNIEKKDQIWISCPFGESKKINPLREVYKISPSLPSRVVRFPSPPLSAAPWSIPNPWSFSYACMPYLPLLLSQMESTKMTVLNVENTITGLSEVINYVETSQNVWENNRKLCNLSEYTCDDGDTEYTDYEKCDGYQDCEDGADEADCPVFPCDSGQEIPANQVRTVLCSLHFIWQVSIEDGGIHFCRE